MTIVFINKDFDEKSIFLTNQILTKMKYNSILIKNAKIVNFDNQTIGNVLIKDGKIEKIDKTLDYDSNLIIEAKGKILFPGFVDPHVHMYLPTPAGYSSDDFYSGSKAALSGGTTSMIDFVTPNKGQSLVDAYLQRLEESKNSLINTKFHVSPVQWLNSTADEMTELVEKYGVKSFKIYMAYKNTVGITDEVLIKVMETAKKLDVYVTAHCENGDIIDFLRQKYVSEGKVQPKYHALSRPAEAEFEAVEKFILFAKYIGTKIYVVHVSTKLAIDAIRRAQKEGVNVVAETCPHYLLLDSNSYDADFSLSGKYVLSPPLRKVDDNEALWEALEDGTIATIGTDHCPFNLKGQKDLGINDFTKIPNGAGSIEHRLMLMYTYGVVNRDLSLQKMVEACSTNPARIFGLKNKGEIKEGFDADLVLFNPKGENLISCSTHLQNCDSNIYEGFRTVGKIETVIQRVGNSLELNYF